MICLQEIENKILANSNSNAGRTDGFNFIRKAAKKTNGQVTKRGGEGGVRDGGLNPLRTTLFSVPQGPGDG